MYKHRYVTKIVVLLCTRSMLFCHRQRSQGKKGQFWCLVLFYVKSQSMRKYRSSAVSVGQLCLKYSEHNIVIGKILLVECFLWAFTQSKDISIAFHMWKMEALWFYFQSIYGCTKFWDPALKLWWINLEAFFLVVFVFSHQRRSQTGEGQ